MAAGVHYPAWLVAALGFVAGWAANLLASRLGSMIHVYDENRKAHLDDLKQRVLIPLRDGLEQHFRPLVFNLKPVVSIAMGVNTHFDEKAKATDEPTEQGDVLLAAFPGATVFGPLDPALLEDAKKSHFPSQMAQVDRFVEHWLAYGGELHSSVSKIAEKILTKSGLPAFPQKYVGSEFQPYVTHFRLAAFIYKRLFRLQAPALRVQQMQPHWVVSGEGCHAALGSKEQMEALVVQIDGLLESEEAAARTLLGRAGELQRSFQELMPKLDHAIAARRLHKRCDLVTFF